MLGKRCRTIQRTASISQNMGPHYLHHHNYHQLHDVTAVAAKTNHAEMTVISHSQYAANPQVPGTIIPQIIGFNPIIKGANPTGGGDQSPAPSSDQMSAPLLPNMPARRPHPHDMYDDDPKCFSRGAGAPPSTKRSQTTPRSALQTLLAAARQITCADQSATKSGEASKSSSKANSTSPSCTNSTIIAVKQGNLIWQGLTLSEATSKELSSNKHTSPKASMLITRTQGAHDEYSQNVSFTEAPQEHHHDLQMSEIDSENIFDVEGTSTKLGTTTDHQISLEPTQDHHALYLATSPLTVDFTPNLAASMSFLESCHLCRRPLGQGRDIFMYRGENAFCSMECREKQMRLEERKEKLRYMHSQINKINVRKRDILYTNGGMGNTHTTSYYQPPKHPHHHQQYGSQAVAYNNKQQHRTSLLMPAA